MMKYGNLMAKVLSGSNMRVAFDQMVANRGSAGVDGMEVDELHKYLHDHFGILKQSLVSGSYVPQARSHVLATSLYSIVGSFSFYSLKQISVFPNCH